MKNKTIIC